MASGTDGRPRHEQIAADLRARIMSGDLAPGSQLPSIPILVTQYSAATATVQRALASLKAEGSVHSAVGKGVYVRDRRPQAVEAVPYLAPSVAGYAYRLIAVREVVPPIEVAESLDLADNDRTVLRHRLLLHDGEPVELSWSYYPASIARGTELAERRKIRSGAPRVLAELGYPPQEMRDRISARMPTTEEVETLSLPPYVPVLRQVRVICSVDGRPVEASVLVKGSHLHELHYRQRLDS
ncbi:GntR family transcriptional regulator [Micromonospora sp. NPDC126480]|uniref:GntR family transcriptional regulator n=1 Tax=Micromonospora sp. NPDC126480 TaxID=3155312 RepID=UPI003329D66A